MWVWSPAAGTRGQAGLCRRRIWGPKSRAKLRVCPAHVQPSPALAPPACGPGPPAQPPRQPVRPAGPQHPPPPCLWGTGRCSYGSTVPCAHGPPSHRPTKWAVQCPVRRAPADRVGVPRRGLGTARAEGAKSTRPGARRPPRDQSPPRIRRGHPPLGSEPRSHPKPGNPSRRCKSLTAAAGRGASDARPAPALQPRLQPLRTAPSRSASAARAPVAGAPQPQCRRFRQVWGCLLRRLRTDRHVTAELIWRRVRLGAFSAREGKRGPIECVTPGSREPEVGLDRLSPGVGRRRPRRRG